MGSRAQAEGVSPVVEAASTPERLSRTDLSRAIRKLAESGQYKFDFAFEDKVRGIDQTLARWPEYHQALQRYAESTGDIGFHEVALYALERWVRMAEEQGWGDHLYVIHQRELPKLRKRMAPFSGTDYTDPRTAALLDELSRHIEENPAYQRVASAQKSRD